MRVTDPFDPAATIKPLFPPGDPVAEVEEICLTEDGRHLVVGIRGPTETIAFGVYARASVTNVFKRIINVETGIQGLDGMRIASLGTASKRVIRVVLGLTGGFRVWRGRRSE